MKKIADISNSAKKFASINFSPDGEINREIEFPKITMTIMTN